MPGLNILWGSLCGAAPWSMCPLAPNQAPGEPRHHSGCLDTRNYCSSRSETDWFLSGNFPPMSIFVNEEVEVTYFGEGEADMNQNPGLIRKGGAGEKKNGGRNFSENEQLHKNGISKSKSSFKGIFFLCFASIL